MENCPALVLNADFRPLSYFPLSLWSWQDAVKAVFLGRVNIVSEYEQMVRSPTFEMRLPSVISLKEYVPGTRRPAFTRFNVFLRDRFTCQYCADDFPTQDLTFDHVIPRSRGGRTTWENVVTACGGCNLAKANHMPRDVGMFPIFAPHQPTTFELQENGRRFPPHFLHQSWRDFLSFPEWAAYVDSVGDKPPGRKLPQDPNPFPHDMTSADYWTAELDPESGE